MNYRLSICGRNHLVLTDIFKSCIAIIGTSRSTPMCTEVYFVESLSAQVSSIFFTKHNLEKKERTRFGCWTCTEITLAIFDVWKHKS